MHPTELHIRPIAKKDLPDLHAMCLDAGYGLTSLPPDRDYLAKKIQISLDSFNGSLDNPERSYLFALDYEGSLIGTAAIDVQPGLKEPFYNLRVIKLTNQCSSLDKLLKHEALLLVNDEQETADLVSLYLKREFRDKKIGKILSRARFNFLANNEYLLNKKIMAEIRGVTDKNGQSPFWEALPKYFYDMTFVEADRLIHTQGKQFIADLFPQVPLYIDLLPLEAKKVINQPHQNSAKAMEILIAEGMRRTKLVHILDAGPTLIGDVAKLKSVMDSKKYKIKDFKNNINAPLSLVGNCLDQYKIKATGLELVSETEVVLTKNCASILDLEPGMDIMVTSLE